MSNMNCGPYYQKLSKRRHEVIHTLDHVQKELGTMDESKGSIDTPTYKRRSALLDSLAGC